MGKWEKEYREYVDYVGRHRGMSREGEIGEGGYEEVTGEVWGEIGKEMLGGEEYDIGGIRIRYEEAGKRGKGVEAGGVKAGMRVIRGEIERRGKGMKKIRYMINGEERGRIGRYEGKMRLYREGVGW